jgi:DNA-binding MarR family transcriptional regulator
MTQDPAELLRRMTRLHTVLQQKTAKECGIQSLTRCQILTLLEREGSRTLAEVSRELGTDKAWMSRNVEALVQDGLVHKQSQALDRRMVALTLTERGQAQAQALNGKLTYQSARLLDRVPAEAQVDVLRALELLIEALEAETQAQEAVTCSSA